MAKRCWARHFHYYKATNEGCELLGDERRLVMDEVCPVQGPSLRDGDHRCGAQELLAATSH